MEHQSFCFFKEEQLFNFDLGPDHINGLKECLEQIYYSDFEVDEIDQLTYKAQMKHRKIYLLFIVNNENRITNYNVFEDSC